MQTLVKLTEYYKSLNKDEIEEFNEFFIDCSVLENPVVEFVKETILSYHLSVVKMNQSIWNMCSESLDNAKSKNIIDIKTYVNQQKAAMFPLMFQPPRITSSIPEERHFINAVFSRWNVQKWYLDYLEKIDKTFEDWK